MAVSLSIDLNNATFADLRALVDAARTAGVDDDVSLVLKENILTVTADDTADRVEAADAPAGTPGPGEDTHGHRGPFSSGNWGSQAGPIGDAAIRSVIDILTGRQEPPRRNG
ncbi:hypothetical protein [Corynebacterium comes]|uniref:Uncharacterized protein n=1 Tax=Corynebacterium comes TaxID=2675218 RepID=A0A6B8W2C8_9CORY|nr:hypothetical protein [Corynebacterium comes]QGU05076.1 hypothetical protein CETAM_09110 [Corynebacterium comes]